MYQGQQINLSMSRIVAVEVRLSHPELFFLRPNL
jgi:hypothetical protein